MENNKKFTDYNAAYEAAKEIINETQEKDGGIEELAHFVAKFSTTLFEEYNANDAFEKNKSNMYLMTERLTKMLITELIDKAKP